MDPLNSISKRVLRFSGVQPQVLKQLETDSHRLKSDAKNLFGESLDVFVKSDEKANSGTVELVADSQAEAVKYFASGFFRNLNRAITGKDIQPTEVIPNKVKTEQTGDFFERTVRSDN